MAVESCVKLQNLNRVQFLVISRHLEKHKWFRHIKDKNDALADFLKEFGPIMREIYCETCEESPECSPYQDYLKSLK